MTKCNKIVLFTIISIFSALFLTALTFLDLDISEVLVDTSSPFGKLFEQIGELCTPYLISFASICLAFYYNYHKELKNHHIKKLFLIVLYFCSIAYTFIQYLGLGLSGLIVGTVINALFVFFTIIYFYKIEIEFLDKLFSVAITIIIYSIVYLVILSIFKLCWGRIRFRDFRDLKDFTPFFMPRGFTGNYSFPSGHAANSASSFAITLLAPLVSPKCVKLLYIFPIMWTLSVCISRVIIGAHFATDVFFGVLISLLSLSLCKYFVKRTLSKLVKY